MNYIKFSWIIFPVKMSTHICLEVSVAYVMSSLYVMNCVKYFLTDVLRQNVSNNQKTKILNYSKSLCAQLF